ncbi:hypothetical protein PVAP13_8KG335102 [Panicum virgatum]|uniref:Uncharacterized protein n=1 Tax=Panicum virgatum TaxID=38727 RepID=A0A8T0PUI9_PANVG|nr:hypothetical protein PVAP13_8KG335102 [Panicum virgatum]
MARRHLGQCLVLASTQLAVSESDLFLASHARTVAHDTGRCASSPQRQQKPCRQRQSTSAASSPAQPRNSTAVDEVADDGRRAAGVRAPQRQAPRAVLHRRADVPAPALVAVEVGGARRRPRPPGGERVEAYGAGERRGAERRGDRRDAAVGPQAGGLPDAALVGEPRVLEGRRYPPVAPQEEGRERRRDREDLGDLGRVVRLPPQHFFVRQNKVRCGGFDDDLGVLGVTDVAVFAAAVVFVFVVVHVVLVVAATVAAGCHAAPAAARPRRGFRVGCCRLDGKSI